MKLETLWENLPPKKENIEIIKKDLSVGIAPHLPFFVVGLDKVKKGLGKLITDIDKSFQFGLIKGQYGNGKTNLLKYLEYFFELNPKYNVHCENWRADVDKYDLNLFLLYILQQSHAESLKECIKKSSPNVIVESCNNYKGTFSVLRNYANLFIDRKDDDNALIDLIQLGTGAKYDKRSFEKYNIDKFSDYNRHEVLVFFLNILAHNNYFILFCIDELEKIEEKSRARFQAYLTSFRELIDLSGLINGHMILCSITDAGKHTTMPLETYNPAFARRIVNTTYDLESVSSLEDIKKIAEALCSVLGENLKNTDIIANKVAKQNLAHTNEIIINLYNNLITVDYKSWREKLKDEGIYSLLEERIEELKDEGVESRINTKFFAPLENYINIVSQDSNEYLIKAQMYQTVRCSEKSSCYIFLFTNDYDANISRIKNVIQLFPDDKLYIFKPEGLSISNSDLQDYNIQQVEDVVNYDPLELMALLTLFEDDYENETLKDAIVEYTKGL